MENIEAENGTEEESSPEADKMTEQLRKMAEDLEGDKPDFKKVNDEGVDLETLGKDIKKSAGKLGEKQGEKTFGEKYISEYQTKKAKIRGTEIERGAAFRFERGQIYKGYKILRTEIKDAEERGEDITSQKQLLKEMRGRAKVMEKNLDEIERQYHENVRAVDIETEFGKFSVPVVELDLKKGEGNESEKDERTPYFFLGGIGTNFQQTACFSMAMALDGHKVYVPMQPEQPSVQKPDNFAETYRKQGDLKIHAKIAEEIIKKVGAKEFNLVGHSTGATTALEIASDPELEGLKDLVVLEPMGIEDKGFAKLAREAVFGYMARDTLPSSEARIKNMQQGAEAGQGSIGLMLITANILSKKLYKPEKLKEINPKGRFQVWAGTQSSYVNKRIAEDVFQETEQLRQAKNPDASPLEFYEVKGGDHNFPITYALGLSKMITAEKPKESLIHVKKKDFEDSAMLGIINEIKK
jgi:hypothetical protein